MRRFTTPERYWDDAAVGDMHVFDGGYAGFAPVGGELANQA